MNPKKEEEEVEEVADEIEEVEETEEIDHEAELENVQPANKELESVLKFYHQCNETQDNAKQRVEKKCIEITGNANTKFRAICRKQM